MPTKEKHTKLLILASDFPPTLGGIQTIISETFKHFERKRASIIAPYNPSAENFDSEYPLKVIRCKFLCPQLYFSNGFLKIFKKSLLYAITGFFPLLRIIKQRKYVIFVCGNIAVTPLAYLMKKYLGLDYVIFVYAMEILCLPREWLRRKIVSAMLENAQKIITISDFSIKEICKFGIDKKNIVKIPLGHHIVYKQKNAIRMREVQREKTYKILTIGRLIERKGHDMVLRAISLLNRDRYRLKYKIVGDGPMIAKLKSLCSQLGINEIVEFIGEVPYYETPNYYRECDLFIMPSRYIQERKDVEGFGVVFLEANYFGKPVIGGDSGGIPDAIKDGVTGLLVNPEDPTDIAEKIEKLMKNPKLARKLGEQGRKRVLEEFTWEKAASIIERTMAACKAGE